MITRIFFEKVGLLSVPLLERLEGRFVVQVLLWDMVMAYGAKCVRAIHPPCQLHEVTVDFLRNPCAVTHLAP